MVCPEGLVCSPKTNTCEVMAVAAGDAAVAMDMASLVDAPPNDAPPPDAPLPNAMVVQQVTNSMPSGATLSATLPNAPVAGRMLVMVGAATSGGLTSVTGGGATWTRAASSPINTNIEIWYGVTDGSSATVTIARTNNTISIWLSVSEWSGLATTSPLDGANANDGTAATISAGSITTTNARDLVIFAASAFAPNTFGTPTPGTWTALTPISNTLITQAVWYQQQAATGTFAPQVTHTEGDWDAAVVALRLQ